jgi:hypothetical protein
LRNLFKQYRQYGYWKVKVIQKHRLPASIRHLVPGGFVLFVAGGLATYTLAWVLILLGHLTSGVAAACGLILLSVLFLYAVSTISASFFAASQFGWDLLPILPLVFAVYHFGYGVGFWEGVWDFVFLRRAGRAGRSELTRR